MAFRSMGYLKSAVNQLRGSRASYTTATSPKMKAYSAAAGADYRQGDSGKQKWVKGDFVPVYVAMGLIALSVSFGLFTAAHQLQHNPSVYVKKKKRQTFPEVVSPDETVEEGDRFIKKSFFRKVAHVQDFDNQEVVPDPIRGDVFAHSPKRRAETLTSVGVDPPPPRNPRVLK